MVKKPDRTARSNESGALKKPNDADLDKLDMPSRIQGNNAQLIISASRQFSGPIPHPQDLSAYETITPGLADRIVKMAETEQIHRHRYEMIQAESNDRIGIRGQIFGLIHGIGCLSIAGYAIFQGQPWVASTAIGAIAGVLGIFILRERYGRASSTEQTDITNPPYPSGEG